MLRLDTDLVVFVKLLSESWKEMVEDSNSKTNLLHLVNNKIAYLF